jgi:hypothetical protein
LIYLDLLGSNIRRDTDGEVKNEMGRRITEAILHNKTEWIEDKCKQLGIINEEDELKCHIGSNRDGVSFALWHMLPKGTEGSRFNQLRFGRFLGWTKKEANLSLDGINDALAAAIDATRNNL